jgi:hypothetical protein
MGAHSMTAFGILVGFVFPMLLLIGKVGLMFAGWRLVSEVATSVRQHRLRFL